MRPRDQQVPLELCDGIERVHRHRAGRTREVSAPKGEEAGPDRDLGQRLDRDADLDRVAAEPVEVGYNQNVSSLELVHQPGKPLCSSTQKGDRHTIVFAPMAPRRFSTMQPPADNAESATDDVIGFTE